MNTFNLGDFVRVKSEPKGLWRIVRIEINLFDRLVYRVVLLGSSCALYRSMHEEDLELVEPAHSLSTVIANAINQEIEKYGPDFLPKARRAHLVNMSVNRECEKGHSLDKQPYEIQLTLMVEAE